jgi:hypothetical protein
MPLHVIHVNRRAPDSKIVSDAPTECLAWETVSLSGMHVEGVLHDGVICIARRNVTNRTKGRNDNKARRTPLLSSTMMNQYLIACLTDLGLCPTELTDGLDSKTRLDGLRPLHGDNPRATT